MLRTDSVDVKITFPHANGDLNLEVLDADNNVLGAGTSLDDDEVVSLTGLAPGTY